MEHAGFRKLVVLEERRKKAIALQNRLNETRVVKLKLSGGYGNISEIDICQFVDNALRAHLADEIDTLTISMAALGVDAPIESES